SCGAPCRDADDRTDVGSHIYLRQLCLSQRQRCACSGGSVSSLGADLSLCSEDGYPAVFSLDRSCIADREASASDQRSTCPGPTGPHHRWFSLWDCRAELLFRR